jgi:predicted Fe-Mo cluster-binding NifX family protein
MNPGNHRKIAMAVWGDLLSPVFDSAQNVRIVDIHEGRVVATRMEALGPELPDSRALRLSEWGVQVLICGAISMEFARTLEMYGITVIGFVSGNTGQVLDAYLKKMPIDQAFRMPGCKGGGRRRRFRGGRP